MKFILTFLVCIVFLVNGIVAQQNFKLIDIEEVKVEGEFNNPKWSPDGSKLLVTKGNHRGLYIIALNNKNSVRTVVDKSGTGYGAAWSAKGDRVFFRERNGSGATMMMYSIWSEEIIYQSNLIPNAVASRAVFKENSIMVYTNLKTLNIQGTNGSNGQSWNITTEGRYYKPVLSPDGTKVVVHKGNDTYVFNSDGSGKISDLGSAIASSWSPDSEYILTYMDEDDGYDVINSDISVYHYTGNYSIKLTDTKDKIEMKPAWSPTSDEISFHDYKSGKIYIAKISRY